MTEDNRRGLGFEPIGDVAKRVMAKLEAALAANDNSIRSAAPGPTRSFARAIGERLATAEIEAASKNPAPEKFSPTIADEKRRLSKRDRGHHRPQPRMTKL